MSIHTFFTDIMLGLQVIRLVVNEGLSITNISFG